MLPAACCAGAPPFLPNWHPRLIHPPPGAPQACRRQQRLGAQPACALTLPAVALLLGRASAWQPLPRWPTRLPRSTSVEVAGRRYTRTRYYLRAEECPDNYHAVLAACWRQQGGAGSGDGGGGATDGSGAASEPAAQPADDEVGGAAEEEVPPGLLPIGITAYTGLFSSDELAAIEAAAGASLWCSRCTLLQCVA